MRRFFAEKLMVLKKAIGVEPPSQIFMNAIRMLIGKQARHWNEDLALEHEKSIFAQSAKEHASLGQAPAIVTRVGYDKYLYDRSAFFTKRSTEEENRKLSMALVWMVADASDPLIEEVAKSIRNQKVVFDKIYIVSPDHQTLEHMEQAEYCQTINEACMRSTEDLVFILKDAAQLNTAFVQESKHYIQMDEAEKDIYYTCDDVVDSEGVNKQPKFKPQYNQYLLYSSNYIGANIIIRRSFGEGMRWFDTGMKDAFVYDFILKSIEKDAKVQRIDEVLIHRDHTNQEEELQERKRALQNHLIRTKDIAKVVDGLEQGTTRLQRSSSTQTLVSIIIPFKDQVSFLKKCVGSILEKTSYKNYEIVLANNGSKLEETTSYIKQMAVDNSSISICDIDIPFNFSKINNLAVEQASGEYLLFLNNDTQIISESWLETMVAELEQDKVGVVGAKLLYEDGTVQHAGVILGVGHIAGHAFRFAKDSDAGQLRRANSTQEYLAVTGACLLTKRNIFIETDKFDEEHLSVSNNDVDYCLKVHDAGYKVVYTPFAKLYHFESKSRSSDLAKSELERYKKEVNFMRQKWGDKYMSDPFFHPHLDNRYENFENVKQIA